jgi:hypothetical protein
MMLLPVLLGVFVARPSDGETAPYGTNLKVECALERAIPTTKLSHWLFPFLRQLLEFRSTD